MATVLLLPLEFQIPSVRGFSIVWIVLAIVGGYALLNRAREVAGTMFHPVFLAAYAVLFVGFVMESLHSYSSYTELRRIGEMVGGAVLVASICRDKKALRAAVYGYLISGLWLGLLLYLKSYGVLSEATATDFEGASRIRDEVFAVRPLRTNLNSMAFISAQGVVVALAFALTSTSPRKRNVLLGIAMFCLLAAFLPMSRAGVVIAIVASLIVMFTYQGKRLRTMVVAFVLGLGTLVWIPNVAFSRLLFSMETYGSLTDSRMRLYTAAIEHFPEFVMTGVGAGNYWDWWAYYNGFHSGLHVEGSHNCFIQVTLYWGLLGLAALIALVWQANRCIPARRGNDVLALCVRGMAVSLLLWMLAMHNLYAKEFSLGLGLLAGARRWIWPAGMAHSAQARQTVRRAALGHMP